MKPEHQKDLLKIAQDAISRNLKKASSRRPVRGEESVQAADLPEALKEKRASFVTLTINGQLRGCIGTLEAFRPLAEDVAQNAHAAAFGDPRFPPLTEEEFEKTTIRISVLSPPEEIRFSSEEELLAQIRPGTDGLILQAGTRRGTFLPSVWEELPDKELFLAHLKMKAGLPPDWRAETLRVFRYTADSFPEEDSDRCQTVLF